MNTPPLTATAGARYAHNRPIILGLMSEGTWPSVNKVLEAGGSGSTGDVKDDVRRLLMELVDKQHRPGASPELLELAQHALDLAWARLGPYREEADKQVQAAEARLEVAETERQAALSRVEGLLQQLEQLQARNLDLERRLAAEAQKVADAADVRARLDAQIQEERKASERVQREIEGRFDVERQDLGQQISKLQQELVLAEHRTQALEERLVGQIEEQRSLREKAERHARSIEERLSPQVNEQRQLREQAEQRAREAEARLAAQGLEHRQIREKLETQVESLQAELRGARDARVEAVTRLSVCEQEIDRLRQEVERKAAEAEQARAAHKKPSS